MASMETDIGGPANVRVCGREQSCEYSRTMRSPYEEFASASAAVDETDHTLPYHAREDSQPFSYGKIGQTSTPLKDGRATHDKYRGVWEDIDPRTNRNRNHFESNSYKYNTYNGSSNNYNSNNSNTLGRSSAQAGPEPSTIKAQPRLTSPLLVRKTLNSGSPTRNSTNTIANTYHYSYNSSSGGGSNGDINKYSFNNNNNNNNYSSNNNKNNYNYNTNTIGHTNNSNHNNNINNNNNSNNNSLRSKTPTRNDFEELLRERRERVYNEYRSTTTARETPSPSKQRQQLSTSSLSSSGAHAPSGQNKYNFDFEFNLNLDDLPPRRSNTMERSSLQYRTHDIPVVTSVERNYHTISSSKAREPAVAWQERGRDRERPPLEASYGRRFRQEATTTTLDRYGNENAAGYRYGYGSGSGGGGGGNEGSGAGGQNRNAADNMSPIYATSSKQRQMQATAMTTTTTTTTRSYRGSQLDVNRGEPELSITDYASAMLSSPTSGAAPLVSRPETPAFPVTPRTPYGANNNNNSSNNSNNNGYNAPPHLPQSPTPRRAADSQMPEAHNYSSETIYQTNANRARLNSSLSLANSEPQEVAPHLVKFAKDSSKFWYKPGLSREEAIALLLHAAPGTFVVRDSTTYKSAYGLVVRVAQPPPGSASGKQDELVRHFLIEPTTRGVRLKGCANEPVFTSLSALVYEHSINALALPCPLLIPEHDLVPPLVEHTPAQKQLLTQGAACHVLWLYSCDTESLTGEEAIRKAIRQLYAQQPPPAPTEVNFKVSQQGITLTDNTRKKFFRKHYVADMISYCAIDPDHRTWTWTQEENGAAPLKKTIFAFVARRSPSSKDNQCHVFCDLAINQPASAIVSFANKTLPTEKLQNYVL